MKPLRERTHSFLGDDIFYPKDVRECVNQLKKELCCCDQMIGHVECQNCEGIDKWVGV